MELWRISNYVDLSGVGGLQAAGRWHTRGKRIVYLADHPSSALLEMLVHMSRDLIPIGYQLLRVIASEPINLGHVDSDLLTPDWRSQPAQTRRIGDEWLDKAATVLLQVPSAISEQGNNYLLNPAHPDAAKITVAEVIKAPFDPRLLAR